MSLALNTFLKPLTSYLDDPEVSEICINKPGELWIEKNGVFHHESVAELCGERIRQLATLVAEYNNKDFNPDRPALSATLPNKARAQFVLNPACDQEQAVCSIRKPTVCNLSLRDWKEQGAFDGLGKKSKGNAIKEELLSLYNNKNRYAFEFLSLALKSKLNIIISAGTSGGKTTLLNSCLKEIESQNERLITVEGVREVSPPHQNVVNLLANEDEENKCALSFLDLLKASLRLRPDRIFVSELRGDIAYPYLRASISGHPGSLTTLHAGSVEQAKEQLALMLAESEALSNGSDSRLKSIVNHSVDVIVQMAKEEDGSRIIDDLYYREGEKHGNH